MTRPLIGFAVALLALSLYLANFSWWLKAEVVDSESFVASTVEVLNEPEARQATASIMVDRLVEQLPILGVIEDGLVRIFTDLLSTQEMQGLLVLIGEELHGRLLSGDRGGVDLNLQPFREPLLTPLAVLAPELVDEVPESWFDSVSVLDGNVIPNVEPLVSFNDAVVVVTSVASLLLVVFIASVSRRWWKAFGLVGAAMAVAGVVSVVLVSVAGSVVATTLPGSSLDVLATSLYGGLTDTLVARSLLLLLAGVSLGGIAVIAWANQALDT